MNIKIPLPFFLSVRMDVGLLIPTERQNGRGIYIYNKSSRLNSKFEDPVGLDK